MWSQAIVRTYRPLIAVLFVSSVVFSGAQSVPPQSSQDVSQPAPAPAKPAGAAQSTMPAQTVSSAKPGALAGPPGWQGAQLNRLSRKADMYYEGIWGVSELHVTVAESGALIRFNYRVLDPQKAAALNDKKAEPQLFDAQAGVKLVVPQVQNVGKLRQSSAPKSGMVYWMAFANPTRVVKPGHRVDVVIGSFRAHNLIVE